MKYKTEILSAVLASLITGVVSLAVGLYSITKSFELTQNKERINSLRADITLLKNIERDLDRNLSLLLTQNFQTVVKYEEFGRDDIRLSQIEDENDKALLAASILAFVDNVFGAPVKIKNVEVPEDLFIEFMFPVAGYIGEIDFELSQDIQDLSFKFSRVNEYVIEIDYLVSTGSSFIDLSKIRRIKNVNKLIEKIIDDISQEKILSLKILITKEINTLQEHFRKIIE